jgi:hypothetical protein
MNKWIRNEMTDKQYKLRSHVCLNIARYQAKYLFRLSLANPHSMEVLNQLFDWLALITQNSFTPEQLALFPTIMQQRLVVIAQSLPITCHNISLHLLYHLPTQIKHYGPLCESWCFGFERWLAFLKKGIKNRAMPSAAMLNYYLRSIHLLSQYSVYTGNDDLDKHNSDLAKAASAAYPLSSVQTHIARQNRMAHAIYLTSTEREGKIVTIKEHDVLMKINETLFYSNYLVRDAYRKFAEANPQADQSDFSHWAEGPAAALALTSPQRRMAAGFLPDCGHTALFIVFYPYFIFTMLMRPFSIYNIKLINLQRYTYPIYM